MKPLLDNEKAEKILSVLVVSYGLWLAFGATEQLLQLFVQAASRPLNWMDAYQGQTIFKLLFGIAIVAFFRSFVQWVCYFASGGRKRQLRVWTGGEILAVVIVVYAILYEILRSFSLMLDSLITIFLGIFSNEGIVPDFEFYISWFFISATFALFGIALLFYARPISRLLLKKTIEGYRNNVSD